MKIDPWAIGYVLTVVVAVILVIRGLRQTNSNGDGHTTTIRIGWGHSVTAGDVIRIGHERYQVLEVNGDSITVKELPDVQSPPSE